MKNYSEMSDFEKHFKNKHEQMLKLAESGSIESVVEALKRQGYCVTSRRYRIVSRIDRPDWQSVHQCPDFYRRCCSKDQLTVSPIILKRLKISQLGYKEFRELDKAREK